MDLRMLESIKRAIPAVMRHLDAYVELAGADLAAVKTATAAKLKALAILSVSGIFAILFLCLLVVALTWDTDYRVLAVGIIAGVFTLTAIAAAAALKKNRIEPFATLKREWREDRELVRSILTRNDDESEMDAPRNAPPWQRPELNTAEFNQARGTGP